MKVLKRRDFARWQWREQLPDHALCKVVRQMESGLVDADLGGRLYKMRVARPGQGKRGGYRAVLSARVGSRYVFLHGFPKNDKGNITPEERLALQLAGQVFLALSPADLEKALALESEERDYDLAWVALKRNRDEWVARMRRMGSCPCKQSGHLIARFRSNPSGSGLFGRSAALRHLSIAELSTAHRALHPIPKRPLRDPWEIVNTFYRRCFVNSRLIESLRSDLVTLRDAGLVDKVTMRRFDAISPRPVQPFRASDIRKLREQLNFSQTVFALHLHTTASTVRKWEQGDTHPSGPALKLLNILADKGLQAIL